MRDLLWEIFQTTGHIGVYLAYREYAETYHHDPDASPDSYDPSIFN